MSGLDKLEPPIPECAARAKTRCGKTFCQQQRYRFGLFEMFSTQAQHG